MTRILSIIDGVLDVVLSDETDHKAARGGCVLADPRIALLGDAERIEFVEHVIETGGDMTGARWPVNVDSEGSH